MIKKITLLCFLILFYSCRDSNFRNSNFSLINSHEHSNCVKSQMGGCNKTWRNGENSRCLRVTKSRKKREIKKNQIHSLFEGIDNHCYEIKKIFKNLTKFIIYKSNFFTAQREILTQRIRTLQEYFYQSKKEKIEQELNSLTYLNNLMKFLEDNLRRIPHQINLFQNTFQVNHISIKGDQKNWQEEGYKNYQNLWETYVFNLFENFNTNFNRLFDRFFEIEGRHIVSNFTSKFDPKDIKNQLEYIKSILRKVPENLEIFSYCTFSNLQEQILEFSFFLKEHPYLNQNRVLTSLFENLNFYIQNHKKSEIKKYVNQLNNFNPQICHRGACPLPDWLEKIKTIELSCFLSSS